MDVRLGALGFGQRALCALDFEDAKIAEFDGCPFGDSFGNVIKGLCTTEALVAEQFPFLRLYLLLNHVLS